MILTVELNFVGDVVALLFSIGIGFLPGIMAYVLLMRAANTEWERLNYSNVLMFVSLINIIFLCSIFFIPNVIVTNPTLEDQALATGLILGLSILDFIVPVFIFGLPIILVGIKNRVKYDADYLILAGILFLFSKFLSFMAKGVVRIQTLFYSIPDMYYGITMMVSSIVAFFAYLSLIQFGFKMKNRHLSISGMLLICSSIGFIPYRLDIVSDVFIWILLTIYIVAIHQIIINEFGDRLTDLELTLSETKKKVAELTKGPSGAKKPPKKAPAKK
jgi:hypothetical protein